MPKRNMRDLIKKETSSQTPKVTESSSTEQTEQPTNKVTNSSSNEGPNLQSTEYQDSGSNEETEVQLKQRSSASPVVSRRGTDDQQSESISNQETEEQTFNNTDSVSHKETNLQSTEQEASSNREKTEQQSNKVTESETNKQPKYLTLLRKEARLREDQFDDLTALARTLNRRRKGGERITENTLIRLAVDLLLKKADQLEGTTEEELRKALDL